VSLPSGLVSSFHARVKLSIISSARLNPNQRYVIPQRSDVVSDLERYLKAPEGRKYDSEGA